MFKLFVQVSTQLKKIKKGLLKDDLSYNKKLKTSSIIPQLHIIDS